MSALAASTAIVRGVLSSMSAAFWFAPLFRNKHTCLTEGKKSTFQLIKQGALQPAILSDLKGDVEDKPSVPQHGGVVEWTPALSVLLVDIGCILE